MEETFLPWLPSRLWTAIPASSPRLHAMMVRRHKLHTLSLPNPKCIRHARIPFTFLSFLFLGSSIFCAYAHVLHRYRIETSGLRRTVSGIEFSTTRLAARGINQDEDETFFCDRSHNRTDVCQMKGDVRVDGQSRSVLLYSPELGAGIQKEEKVRPYTRKWETSIMETIDEVTLRRAGNSTEKIIPECEVQLAVPAIVFSTGGYTGNVYHEFNDGLIPLFISSQHLEGEVVFMIIEYHHWWETKYEEIVKQLTNYEILDFTRDKRVHCFPEVVVGLRIHGELAIDSKLMQPAVSMRDFQQLLHRAYLPTSQRRAESKEKEKKKKYKKQLAESRSAGKPHFSQSSTKLVVGQVSIDRPKLVIVSRKSPRAVLNEAEVTDLAKRIGFEVKILAPKPSMMMVDVYQILNSCDVMIGVHGAAMTHLLFMRPGSTFIQVVPLGTDWAAFTYYEEPATKLGLHYVGYKITPEESSLSKRYALDDPVLTDPDSVNSKGWWETKKIYLENQDVRLSLVRFKNILKSAYTRAVKRSIKL